MEMTGQVLSRKEQELIHQKALDILAEIGVLFPDHQVLDLLEGAGAWVDHETQTARFGQELVQAALDSAPKSFLLGARNPEHDFLLPSCHSALNLDGTGVYTLDHETGERRYAVLKDVSDAARVFEELPLAKILWPPVVASDCPAKTRNLLGSATSFLNCSKHIQDEVKQMDEIPELLSLLEAVLGDRELIAKRNIYSVTYCPVAPLSHDRDMMLANMELTKYGIPILIYPMPACGSTGPASLYSNLAMAVAESLSALVLFQLCKPGTPLIFGSAQGIIHRKSGLFLEGAPETILQGVAMAQMGKFYDLPVIIAGCLTDAKVPGMQAVLEKLLTALPLAQAGTDVIQGIGLLESSMTLHLPQMVIDHEIGLLCSRMRQGIEISEEKDYFSDIAAVGPGGHFLKQQNTRSNFKSGEYSTSKLLDRSTYDEWVSLGSPSLLEGALGKVTEILSSPPSNPLPKDKEAAVLALMEKWMSEPM